MGALLVSTQEGGNFTLSLADGGALPVQTTNTAAALLQSQWFVDPVNGNDNNAGTQASPVKTVMGGIVPKWGTASPIFPPSVTLVQINFVSDEAFGQEVITLRPTMTGIAPVFAIVGTYIALVNGSLNAVTAKNRATGQRLASTFTGFVPALGNIVRNTTRGNSRSPVINVGSGTLCQPLSTAPAAPPNKPTAPTEVDTWANGDAVVLERFTHINLGEITVTFNGNFNAAGTSQGLLWIQAIEAIDQTGTGGNSNTIIQTNSGTAEVIDCVIDTQPVIASVGGASLGQIFLTGCFVNESVGQPSFAGTVTMRGGATLGAVSCSGQVTNFAQDVSIGGDINVSGAGVGITIGTVFCGGGLKLGPGGVLGGDAALVNDATGACAFYGAAATVQVRAGGALYKSPSATSFVACLLNGGAITIDNAATASQYVAPTWTGGITINPTNLDAHGGLLNPISGSRIAVAA